MNILFDFITVQTKTGAGEYHRKVFFELLNTIEKNQARDVKIMALFDSASGIAYDDLLPESLSNYPFVSFVDCWGRNIDEIVDELHIDTFFIACTQYLRNCAGIGSVNCRVICVTHDIASEDLANNRIIDYLQLLRPESQKPMRFSWWRRAMLKSFFPKQFHCMDKFIDTYLYLKYNNTQSLLTGQIEYAVCLKRNNPKARLIAVSNFTKLSMVYHYGIKEEDITVLYSPERIYEPRNKSKEAQNQTLLDIIESGKKYYLMVSADRDHKNPFKVIKAFGRFQSLHPESYIVTIGLAESSFNHHICLPFLNDEDLAFAYKYCHALIYPSFIEGFGYPPLECMRHGKPVLASNSTSIREILGDAPIYFCPFYESEIFQALCTFVKQDYQALQKKSLEQYESVHLRQEEDLNTLTSMIVGNQQTST